ncbi:gamma-glutamyltranspeptidase [Tricholoma matsutake]|nr:gamma-glutamyltranspeptidase [Tricholoma matsutake 945]
MDDFSIPGIPNVFDLLPSPYNFPEPGKRPFSSTIPTIIEHAGGSLFVAIGGSGGSQIFGAIFQTLLNLDLGLDVSQVIEFGRLHDQLYPPILEANSVYPPEILDGLRGHGHNVTVRDINRVAAAVQAVVQQNGKITAASNSRKNGIASGY